MSSTYKTTLKLSELTNDPRLQMRESLNQDAVLRYRDIYAGEIPDPADPEQPLYIDPPHVVFDGETYWLADGAHRHRAAELAELTEIEVLVSDGDFLLARDIAREQWHKHGVPFTTADQKKLIQTALEDHPDWTAGRIAAACGVSKNRIRRARQTAEKEQASGPRDPVEQIAAGEKTNCNGNGEEKTNGDGNGVVHEEAQQVVQYREDARGHKHKVSANGSRKNERQQGEDEQEERDDWGIPIQEHARAAFADSQQFDLILEKLKEAAALVNELVDMPGGGHLRKRVQWVRNNSKAKGKWLLVDLDNAIQAVTESRPGLTDCPYAHSATLPHPEDCQLCYNLGWLPNIKGFKIEPELKAAMQEHYKEQPQASKV